MRRLWLSLALLGLIFAATVGNSLYLRHLTDTITGLLEEAQVQAQEEDWEAVSEKLKATRTPESRKAFLRQYLMQEQKLGENRD